MTAVTSLGLSTDPQSLQHGGNLASVCIESFHFYNFECLIEKYHKDFDIPYLLRWYFKAFIYTVKILPAIFLTSTHGSLLLSQQKIMQTLTDIPQEKNSENNNWILCNTVPEELLFLLPCLSLTFSKNLPVFIYMVQKKKSGRVWATLLRNLPNKQLNVETGISSV